LWTRDALEEVDKFIAEDTCDAEALYWRARCALRGSHRAKAYEDLKQTEAEGHTASKELLERLRTIEGERAQGDDAFHREEFAESLSHYDAAVALDELRLDPYFSAALLWSRSGASNKAGQGLQAIEDATDALSIAPGAKEFFRRGVLNMEVERYRDARDDFGRATALDAKLAGLSEWQARAARWAAKPPRRNYYALLGVGFEATLADIKKAYKVAALKWHPDKNPASPEDAENTFKDVQEGYEILTDPKKRRAYDGLLPLDEAYPSKSWFSGAAGAAPKHPSERRDYYNGRGLRPDAPRGSKVGPDCSGRSAFYQQPSQPRAGGLGRSGGFNLFPTTGSQAPHQRDSRGHQSVGGLYSRPFGDMFGR